MPWGQSQGQVFISALIPHALEKWDEAVCTYLGWVWNGIGALLSEAAEALSLRRRFSGGPARGSPCAASLRKEARVGGKDGVRPISPGAEVYSPLILT